MFPGLVAEHFHVKFDDLAESIFEISCGKTDTQTNGSANPTPATAVGVITHFMNINTTIFADIIR